MVMKGDLTWGAEHTIPNSCTVGIWPAVPIRADWARLASGRGCGRLAVQAHPRLEWEGAIQMRSARGRGRRLIGGEASQGKGPWAGGWRVQPPG